MSLNALRRTPQSITCRTLQARLNLLETSGLRKTASTQKLWSQPGIVIRKLSSRPHFHTTTGSSLSFKQASFSPYIALVVLVAGSAIVVDYVTGSASITAATSKETQFEAPEKLKEPQEEAEEQERRSAIDEELSALFAAMATPQGTLGNLTAEQDQKLKDFWVIVLKTFGIQDPAGANGDATRPITPATAPPPTESESAKKEKHGLFHRKHKDSNASSPRANDPEDKYNQTRDLQEILANSTPAELRAAFWSMVKKDHPDALLLRFLRARKWDVQRALAMMVSTMHWRRNEMHVDDDIMLQGEGGALKDSESSEASVKKEGGDFIQQLRMGKSFIHGADKEGRPVCFVRVRLHRGGEQSERSMERYTVFVIETARLALTPPVETATIVFDMTSFTMANMDYTPVKFMIKVFEANYPDSLGCVLVHKAPWIFQGIWKIIKGWLDPVVAAKVHFTNGVEDLSDYIPKSQIIKELGGNEDWEYKYLEPSPNENSAMNDTAARKELEAERQQQIAQYEAKTFDWIHGMDTKSDRDVLAQSLRDNYWSLDPIIRARSLYDRTGMLGRDGKINYYPSQTLKKENMSPAGAADGLPPGKEASEDDVD